MSEAAAPTVPRWVLHVDLDQFLAAVEMLRHPELRGRPVVVGGDGDPTRARQVVSTASYEARAYGVHSGMPLRTAYRKCPDAVFLPVDHAEYDRKSAEVMAALRSFDSLMVEVWGWDEAFAGTDVDDPVALAHEVRAKVLDLTELSCSVGVGRTRLQAKTATSFGKPAGVGAIPPGQWLTIMGDKPVDAIWGIGTRIARRLGDAGVSTVRDLAEHDVDDLAKRFGPTIGPHLAALGRGGTRTPMVDEPWVPRGKSRETTYERDLTDAATIEAEVVRLAEELTREVVADGRRVVRVAVKVRTSTFWTRTKIRKLATETTDPAVVADGARLVLSRFELDRPVRLLGVRVELDWPPAGSA